MNSVKILLLAMFIVAQVIVSTNGEEEGATVTEPPSLQDQIDELKKEVTELTMAVKWVQNELAIPGLVWFLFLMFWFLLLMVLFIFYALRCRGRGLPGSNCFP